MELFQPAGISFIISVQQVLHPKAGGIWAYLSYLGEENFYMLVIPAFYWCLQPAIGVRMLVFLLASTFVNELGKMLMHGPRPYWVDARVQGLYAETSFGIPSGHAQNGLGFWTYLALLVRREYRILWTVAAAVFLGLLISFSRMALGVHFPHDLVGGWILAGFVLLLFLAAGEKSAASLQTSVPLAQVGIGIACGLGVIVVGAATSAYASAAGVPQPWLELAARAHAAIGRDTVIPDPYSTKTILSVAGTLIGISFGVPLAARYAPFSVEGKTGVLAARFVLGIATLFIIQFGLSAAFPKAGASGYEILRVVRYAIVGAYAVFGAPLLFLKLGLMRRRA